MILLQILREINSRILLDTELCIHRRNQMRRTNIATLL